MAFSEQVMWFLQDVGVYLALLPLAVLLFRFRKSYRWFFTMGFLVTEGILGFWMHHLGKQGINNWHLMDWFSPLEFLFMGGLMVSVKPNRQMKISYLITGLIIIVSLLIKDKGQHWNLQICHAAYIIFGGLALMKMIQDESEVSLTKNGLFWIIIAQFVFQFIEMVTGIIYELVHLPHDEFWSMFLMQSFTVGVILYYGLITFGVWNFRRA